VYVIITIINELFDDYNYSLYMKEKSKDLRKSYLLVYTYTTCYQYTYT